MNSDSDKESDRMKRIVAVLLLFLLIMPVALTSCGKPAETTADVTEPGQITDEASYEITDTEKTTEPENNEETTTETEAGQAAVTETEEQTEIQETTDNGPTDKETTVGLVLPENSRELSYDLAKILLTFCYGYTEEATTALLKAGGFEILFTKNYDKSAADKSHTCAYTVAKGKYNGKSIYAIVIRGTEGGEWYSNLDFAPSHDNNTKFAENFYMAAHDIFLSVKELFDSDPDSYKVICGHSRGAAASNLLGVTLDNVYNKKDIYVYTFATPNTVRGEEAEPDTEGEGKKYYNIFNFINPADLVAYVPLEAHGFRRAGTDIMLSDEENKSKIITGVESLVYLAPDIKSYYENKYSLTEKGLSDDGMSVYDVLQYIAAMYASDYANMDLSKLLTMSPESDLYAALGILTEFSDSKNMIGIAYEHSVSRYTELIIAKQAEQ